MPKENSQQTWNNYYDRKRVERLNEAAQLWKKIQRAGIDEETILALDFAHFGTSQSDVEKLAKQLSENYTMQVVADANGEAWFAQGTTRPYGITLTQQQHLDWVAFMADVAQSYSCVFSTWSLEAPSLKLRFDNEQIESNT